MSVAKKNVSNIKYDEIRVGVYYELVDIILGTSNLVQSIDVPPNNPHQSEHKTFEPIGSNFRGTRYYVYKKNPINVFNIVRAIPKHEVLIESL